VEHFLRTLSSLYVFTHSLTKIKTVAQYASELKAAKKNALSSRNVLRLSERSELSRSIYPGSSAPQVHPDYQVKITSKSSHENRNGYMVINKYKLYLYDFNGQRYNLLTIFVEQPNLVS